MKEQTQQTQMSLFGTVQTLDKAVAAVLTVTPKYLYRKVKVNGKWKIERDKNGEPIAALNADGEKIVASERVALLPRHSKDNKDLSDVTGLTGQALFPFEREARDAICDISLAEFQRRRASGEYTYGSVNRNFRTGALTLTIKPVFGGRSVVTSTDEELKKEMERRGFEVKPGTKHDGETNKPKETKPKQIKDKGKEAKAS
jgi:hypothetical protein